jgi:hypothetical protein
MGRNEGTWVLKYFKCLAKRFMLHAEEVDREAKT